MENNPLYRFDLIYIDGCHAFRNALSDIVYARRLAHSGTILWIDDVSSDLSGDVGTAVNMCEKLGLIKIVKIHQSSHPTQFERSWAEGRFICD